MFSELIKKLIKSQFASDDDSPEAQANELPPIAPQPVKSEFNDEWLAANLPRIDEATAMRAERQQPPQMPQNFALPEIEQTQALPDEAVVQTAPEMPTVAEVPEVRATVNTPMILPELQSVETQRKINDIHDKDYSKAQMDEQGNITKEAGKDRDQDWSWKEKLGGVGLGLLNGVLSGRGLIGGIPEAIENGTNRNFSEQRRDNQQLGSLLPQLGQQQKQEEFQTGQDYKKAQIADVIRKPEKEEADRQGKMKQEVTKQINRLELLHAKDIIADANYKGLVFRNGLVFKEFKDGRTESVIDPRTGEQEVELLKQPTETEITDGINPDGTPRQKKVYMTGGQNANLKSNEAYRDAVMKLNRERMTQQDSQFNQRIALDKEKFAQAKVQFQSVIALRVEAQANLNKSRTDGNEMEMRRFEQQVKTHDANLAKMRQAAFESKPDGENNGELTDDQYNELINLINELK